MTKACLLPDSLCSIYRPQSTCYDRLLHCFCSVVACTACLRLCRLGLRSRLAYAVEYMTNSICWANTLTPQCACFRHCHSGDSTLACLHRSSKQLPVRSLLVTHDVGQVQVRGGRARVHVAVFRGQQQCQAHNHLLYFGPHSHAVLLFRYSRQDRSRHVR